MLGHCTAFPTPHVHIQTHTATSHCTPTPSHCIPTPSHCTPTYPHTAPPPPHTAPPPPHTALPLTLTLRPHLPSHCAPTYPHTAPPLTLTLHPHIPSQHTLTYNHAAVRDLLPKLVGHPAPVLPGCLWSGVLDMQVWSGAVLQRAAVLEPLVAHWLRTPCITGDDQDFSHSESSFFRVVYDHWKGWREGGGRRGMMGPIQ